jgi:hypothetical protein
MGLMKELAELNAIYQKMSTPDVDEAMIVTNADKKGNTPAYQNYKKGMKKKDGTPMYKAADHMKEEEVIDEKMNAGLRAYLDKKMKGKKTDDKEENGNGKNGKASKGSKPDFLDLDKDGNKTEPMKSAAKSKKEETEYNYVNQYIEMAAPRMQKGAMAYDGPNKAASEAKDRVMAKTKAKRKGPKPTVTIDKPDSLVSMKVSKGYKESFDKLVESGMFSDIELQRIIFDDFEENYRAMRNPEKYKPDDESDKPYRERSREARMKDPKRGINSPAFKKFMADRGM